MAWSPSLHRTALAVALALGGAVALAAPAHALVVVYQANLNGMNESPPNASPGSGTAFLSVDEILNTMRLQVSFSGLTGNTIAAHIPRVQERCHPSHPYTRGLEDLTNASLQRGRQG
jgi:hypothetical protein